MDLGTHITRVDQVRFSQDDVGSVRHDVDLCLVLVPGFSIKSLK